MTSRRHFSLQNDFQKLGYNKPSHDVGPALNRGHERVREKFSESSSSRQYYTEPRAPCAARRLQRREVGPRMYAGVPLDVPRFIHSPPTSYESVDHVRFVVEVLCPRLLIFYHLVQQHRRGELREAARRSTNYYHRNHAAAKEILRFVYSRLKYGCLRWLLSTAVIRC